MSRACRDKTADWKQKAANFSRAVATLLTACFVLVLVAFPSASTSSFFTSSHMAPTSGIHLGVWFCLCITATQAIGGGVHAPMLYVYTGFEQQPTSAAEKTSLYSIDPTSGRTTKVVDFDNGVEDKSGDGDCLVGQDAHFAYSSSTQTIYGLPEGGADSPMIMHTTKTNTSVCDDSVENAWGLTLIPGDDEGSNRTAPASSASTAGDAFVAFSSSYSSLGQWSFEVALVHASGSASKSSAATWTTELSWDDSTKKSQYNMFNCAINTGFAAVDATKGQLFILCGGGEGGIPWVIYTVSGVKKNSQAADPPPTEWGPTAPRA